MKLKIADAGRRELPASTVHRILCEEVPMYPMDRIQQKHARQIDLLENLTAVIQIIQIQPVSGTKLENLFLQYAVS